MNIWKAVACKNYRYMQSTTDIEGLRLHVYCNKVKSKVHIGMHNAWNVYFCQRVAFLKDCDKI
jgi:hypothetical protein